ncbi:hypothetical protein FRC02_011148 [Tulasnella sp. 418]|nr:hypothetical protein FRC02_011148 [Tulasnella sp. 418]
MSTETLVAHHPEYPKHHYEQVNQLDDASQEKSKSPFYGPLRVLGLAPITSLSIVLFWSFGMGSVLLIWLLAHRTYPSHPTSNVENQYDAYFLVNEGNKTGSMKMLNGEDSIESTMRGVLIITAISHFSSIAVVPLMSLGAFYIAAHWLNGQVHQIDGPTPAQLLLLIKMCSEGSWQSVFETAKYLFARYKTKLPHARAEVSSLVYRAMVIASTVVILHYGVVATDLWLSAELGSGYYSIEEVVDFNKFPIASMLGTQNNPTIKTHWLPPNSSTDDMWVYINEGNAIVIGQSSKNYIALVNTSTSSSIQDESHMAVIVRPPNTIPSHWLWTAPSIGMKTECQPGPCSRKETKLYTLDCPAASNISYPPIPLPSPSFDYGAFVSGRETIKRYSANGEIDSDLLVSSGSKDQQANPLYYAINFITQNDVWSFMKDPTSLGTTHYSNPDDANTFGITIDFYYGVCEVTLYDVEVSFNGFRMVIDESGNQDVDSLYNLASTPVPMSQDRALQVLAPLVPLNVSILDSSVMVSLWSAIGREVIHPGLSKKVSAEFSRQVLAYIAGMNVTTIPASQVSSGSAKLFSLYPLMQTLAYVVVVYAHGALAIILFVGIVGKTSRTVVVRDGVWRRNWSGDVVEKKQKPVQELVLVQSRLTNPLALIAERFLEPDIERHDDSLTSAGALSVQTDAIGMIQMERSDTSRIEIGLIDYHEGERWYGLKHRRQDVLVVNEGVEA